MNKLYVLVGETCSGKDTIMELLLKRIKEENLPIKKLISNTNRPMRKNETQGVEYNFTSMREFDEKYRNNQVLEYATYKTDAGTWVYYTLISDLKLSETSMIKIINPLGLSQIRQQIPPEQLVVIHITASEDIRRNRYLERCATVDSVNHRFERDKMDFKYFKSNYQITNNGDYPIESRVDAILKIIKGNEDN
jgi:guanylate kinase